MSLGPRDAEFLPILTETLPLAVVADPNGRVGLDDLCNRIRRLRMYSGGVPVGTLRRVLQALGYGVQYAESGTYVLGLRIRCGR